VTVGLSWNVLSSIYGRFDWNLNARFDSYSIKTQTANSQLPSLQLTRPNYGEIFCYFLTNHFKMNENSVMLHPATSIQVILNSNDLRSILLLVDMGSVLMSVIESIDQVHVLMLTLLCLGCGAKFKNKSSLFGHKRRHESKTLDVEGKCLISLL